MRICLDVSPAIHHRAGIGRYVQELTSALLAVDQVNEYIAFFNRSADAQVSAPFNRLVNLAIRWDDRPWRLKVLLAQMLHVSQDHLFTGIDLFHGADNLLPYISSIPSIFTLYDVAFRFYPETHTVLNRWFLTLMLPRFLKFARVVTTISECSRRDAVRLYSIAPDKIRVIYPGVSARFCRADPEAITNVRRRYSLPEQYVLHVGTLEPRKNLLMLLEAFKQASLSNTKLVIAGKRGWLYEQVFARVQTLGLEDAVIFTGLIPDADLPELYSGATTFLFPSLYEGFGLPVLEAMACGTPVICSNSSSLPEVAGEAAVLLPPDDVRGWAQSLSRVVTNTALQADLRQRGLLQAEQFTWETTARQTLAIYQENYGHHS